jgi:imidazolonepropionase
MTLLFVNATQVVTCAGAPRARVGIEMRDCGVRTDAAVAVERERIVAVGPRAEIERAYEGATRIDCGGGVLTPGLVDSHTHAIFGRARYEEQERRAAGADYMEIARQGGGIHASVRDLRARDASELLALARPRLERLASYGTTTVEMKSGYGLSIEDELKILRVIRELAAESPMRIVPTWLGAHEIPKEARATPATRAS